MNLYITVSVSTSLCVSPCVYTYTHTLHWGFDFRHLMDWYPKPSMNEISRWSFHGSALFLLQQPNMATPLEAVSFKGFCSAFQSHLFEEFQKRLLTNVKIQSHHKLRVSPIDTIQLWLGDESQFTCFKTMRAGFRSQDCLGHFVLDLRVGKAFLISFSCAIITEVYGSNLQF